MDLTIPNDNEQGGAAVEPRFLPAQQLLEQPAIVAIQEKIDRITIATDADRTFAVESRTLLSKLGKTLEAKRKEALAPAKKETEEINEWYRDRLLKIEEWKGRIDRELTADRRRQEEAAQKLREAQEEIQRRSDAEAREKEAAARESLQAEIGADFSSLEGLFQQAPKYQTPVQEPAKTIRTASGGVSVRKIWTWELQEGLTDDQALALLPLAFHTINRGEITRAVQGGSRDIPGLRIFQKEVNADM